MRREVRKTFSFLNDVTAVPFFNKKSKQFPQFSVQLSALGGLGVKGFLLFCTFSVISEASVYSVRQSSSDVVSAVPHNPCPDPREK